jgi:hypothetical protein
MVTITAKASAMVMAKVTVMGTVMVMATAL